MQYITCFYNDFYKDFGFASTRVVNKIINLCYLSIINKNPDKNLPPGCEEAT